MGDLPADRGHDISCIKLGKELRRLAVPHAPAAGSEGGSDFLLDRALHQAAGRCAVSPICSFIRPQKLPMHALSQQQARLDMDCRIPGSLSLSRQARAA